MVLLTFEGSDAGWEAATRTYLAIIASENTQEVSNLVSTSAALADLDSETRSAFEAVLRAMTGQA